MSNPAEAADVSPALQDLQRTARLLGVNPAVRRQLDGPLGVHEVIRKGLPAAVLERLLASLVIIPAGALLTEVVRISVRQHQRIKKMPAKHLDAEVSGRTWMFAEILAKATDMLGSQKEAELWLDRPALGLNHRRPLELLTTQQGMRAVDTYIEQIRHGAYV